ncbi:Uncharacterized protein APZ42_015331 [Daphnia magna]|uniref:Uncharacterized protein n=1 Tax=Daphnia magna TaxID=35525 RepID=A0A162PDK6_9CRUS|nr:Uncharacterized protein APZ42_015331 [Daphnia magna]
MCVKCKERIYRAGMEPCEMSMPLFNDDARGIPGYTKEKIAKESENKIKQKKEKEELKLLYYILV